MEHAYKNISVFFILLFCCLGVTYPSPNMSRVVGEMMMVGFNGTTINDQSAIVKAIKKYHIGGVILFDRFEKKQRSKTITRNISSPKQLKRLTARLQYYAKKYRDAPLFIAVNQEGGKITTLTTEKGFNLDGNDSQEKLGKMNDQKIIYDQAVYRGKLLKRYGINLNLAPVADLNLNPSNPAVGKLERSFGPNPVKVTKDLMAAIKAYKKAGILCTLKHFPGLGSSKTNTDYHATDITKTWQITELIPYRQLINSRQSCAFIMLSHHINRRLDKSGLEATLSYRIATGLLRRHLHFQGLIITDDMDAKAIRNHVPTKKAIRLAVMAGNNIILYGGTQGHDSKRDATMLYTTMMNLAADNKSIRAQMLDSYRKIIKIKRMFIEDMR